jgi:hypothetical protein
MAAVPQANTACIYCGATDNLTSDHVPPRNLFPRPRPSNLITVPACKRCNKGFEQDDEYFRIAVVVPADPARDPVAARLWSEKVVRGTLKRSPALRSAIIRTLTRLDVTTPAGLYLGTASTIRLNRKRVDRTIRRIVTALHWRHYGHVPNPGVKFTITMGPDPKRPGVAEHVARDLLGGKMWSVIGPGLFRYAYNRVKENPDWGAWLLAFHSTVFAVVVLSGAEDRIIGRGHEQPGA